MSVHLEQRWSELRDRFLVADADVQRGKMMSADALTWRGKVFVFYSTKGGRTGLGCKIGRNTVLPALGLEDWQHLAPFKSKPPMKDWIVLGEGDVARWSAAAALCLDLAKNEGH